MLLNCGVGEDSWESLGSKEIKSAHPKGNQSWIFIGRTDAEAEIPILWPPDVKNWLIGQDPDARKYWRQEKGMTEDEMVGWHHWLDGHEFEQAPGVGDGQGSLVCCSPPGHKDLDTNERLNRTDICPSNPYSLNTEFNWLYIYFIYSGRYIYIYIYHSGQTEGGESRSYWVQLGRYWLILKGN